MKIINTLKISCIYLLAYAILMFSIFLTSNEGNLIYVGKYPYPDVSRQMLYIGTYLAAFFLYIIFFSYFLFVFKEKVNNKSIFWKLPLISLAAGSIIMFFASGYAEMKTCLEMECLGAYAIPIFASAISMPIYFIIGLVLSFNVWYKTSLYMVAWIFLIFVVLIQMLISFIGIKYIFLLPLAILLGTAIASYFSKNKKISIEEIEKF